MKQIFYGVLLMSAAGSAVFALFKMVTTLLGKKLSPKWRYNALKACTLLFVLPLSLFGKLMQKAAVPNTVANTAPVFALAQNDTVQAAAQAAGHNVFLSFTGVWAFGVLLVVLWQTFCFIKLRLSTAKYAVKASAKLQATAQKCAETLGIRQKPMLFISKNSASPVLIGLFTPIVLLPSEVLPKEGTDFMLKHELTHFRRKDLWLKIAFVLVKAIHWFNPLVFIACRELNLWCEYSCDTAVADGLCHEEKKQYAMAIILAAANVGRAGIGFGVPFISSKKKIERRLDFIFSYDNSKDKKAFNRAAAAFMVTAMLTAGALTAYANPRAAEPAPPEAVSFTDTEQDISTNTSTSTGFDEELLSTVPSADTEKAISPNASTSSDFDEELLSIEKLISPVGEADIYNKRFTRDGVDISTPKGAAIYAAYEGTVVVSNNTQPHGYGKHIIIEHSNGYKTVYGHNIENLVEVGDKVLIGDLIAKAGRSGNASNYMLHFEVLYQDMPLALKDIVK